MKRKHRIIFVQIVYRRSSRRKSQNAEQQCKEGSHEEKDGRLREQTQADGMRGKRGTDREVIVKANKAYGIWVKKNQTYTLADRVYLQRHMLGVMG